MDWEEDVKLPWAPWWQSLLGRGCRARWPGPGYRARCELVRNHDGDHAVDRGMEVLRWK